MIKTLALALGGLVLVLIVIGLFVYLTLNNPAVL